MTFRCFVSHPWADNIHHFAVRLCDALRHRDVEVWIDQEQMLPGQRISVRQIDGIARETDVFVCVLAPATLLSRNCLEELDCALKHQKPIVTALAKACEVPVVLRDTILVDFTNPVYFEAAVDRLTDGALDRVRWATVVETLDDDDADRRSEAARLLSDTNDVTAFHAVKRRITLEQDDTVMQWLTRYLGTVQFVDHVQAEEAHRMLQDLDANGQLLTRRAAHQGLKDIAHRKVEVIGSAEHSTLRPTAVNPQGGQHDSKVP